MSEYGPWWRDAVQEQLDLDYLFDDPDFYHGCDCDECQTSGDCE
jgi:hypothetical protein